MKTRRNPANVNINAPAPTVLTLDPDSDLGRLAVAFGKAIDRADAAERKCDRYARKKDVAKTEAYEAGPWEKAMARFDRTERALFKAMRAKGLRAVVVAGRLYVDIQTDEAYLPDRPQFVTWWTIVGPNA